MSIPTAALSGDPLNAAVLSSPVIRSLVERLRAGYHGHKKVNVRSGGHR